MKAIFFADAHLTESDRERIGIVSRAIREITRDADIVFILGDLFEFYHGHDGYIYPCYKELIDALRMIAAERTVYFIEGNHEFGMGEFFETYTGVRCVEGLTINMDDKKVFLSHGDEMGSPALRRILKSRLIYSIMDRLGPSRTWKIAMLCRHFLSRSNKPHDRAVLDRFRRYGKRKLREGYDAVVIAHSHMADIEEHEWNGKKRTYMNTGGMIASLSYGVYVTGKGFTVNTYDWGTS
jgi:UDP-2,3-diacylglucosamine hydrolase